MKRLYWRPKKVSKSTILLVGLLAVGGTLFVERAPTGWTESEEVLSLAAARRTARSFNAIREERTARGLSIDRRFDPTDSGLIGRAMSPVTSLPAPLEAKQTSVNPNFAVIVVELLSAAGVEPGDLVAVGYTGSMPALNVAVCAALETMQVTPIVIHSAASSQFGANDPAMMWLDMERVLYDRELISFRSHVATLGGYGDRARGMPAESKALLRASIDRNDVPTLEIKTLAQSIDERMRLYEEIADGEPIKAYINVGGGAASIRGAKGKDAFGAGLTLTLPAEAEQVDCVATRFAARGTPVLHLGAATELAEQYGFPIAPRDMPAVGPDTVVAAARPSRGLAGALLFVILGVLRLTVWTTAWQRAKSHVAARIKRKREATPHAHAGAELMV